MKRKEHGTILMITLMLLSIMGILAVSFLLISTQDYRVAAREEWNTRTFYSARSGLEYYEVNQAAMPAGTKKKITIDEEGSLYCDIEVTDTEIISAGIVTGSGGDILAQRIIRAHVGDVGRWYEAASP
jgi:Tfp pilus assembly protein PilX